MPIYTYHCDNCGIRFDQQQKFTDEPLTLCPECNEPTLRKIYQPVGIVFKGKGFYATDHRSPSGQNHTHAKAENASESKSEDSKAAGASSSTDAVKSSNTKAAE
ncbi:MAG: zinc ribbon domain-containing protein [Chloroflexi bacterium]|jgi:putative FmdB family regulatory protein|nr:zinc ribbon domain-containing protein [Anaerolineaceae bacterium]NLI45432.1 zinc ribbon domain-containing protein [Chloroflexota bacterium]HOE35620.1 zinc ribbon domain-containing protein [Anaerolineaceae bacterium]HOT26232.1 zinc ribbon domain-containing protein [Anaerolineaceae bacterium]HQH58305.1 zinc ribbon domain-containing protein [Anaerolineaceae bacterium]